MGREIAVLLKGYPRLSETFIAQELRGLERRGLHLRIYSMRLPTDSRRHPVHGEIQAPVVYLPEYLYRAPFRVAAGFWACRRRPGFAAALNLWVKDFIRDPTPNRLRRFGQALVLARELPDSVGHIHAHFLHTPASVARYAARISGRGWSCSAHAKDIWTTPEWEKREKLAECAWLVTCTQVNRDHLRGLASEPAKVELVYHGLDLSRFPRRSADVDSDRDGSSPAQAVRLLCVGRAVEKKGLDTLLQALARLPSSLHWEFHHVGSGPLLKRLKRAGRRLGLSDRVRWDGALSQSDVIARYRAADIFVLASCIARDGDRDGLPNVLMEAQSQGLACIATRLSAIPELIDDGETGVLVTPGDPDALASALIRLIQDPALRRRLGRAGETRVRSEFRFIDGVDRIASNFTATLDAAR